MIILLISPFFLADTITGYVVTDSVPLNQGVTATGIYSGDVNFGVLCSFYFFDSNGKPVNRATDQYTDSSGRFFMPAFPVTEPVFQRNRDFNIITTCGTATANDSFFVGQRQEFISGVPIYPQALPDDLLYWRDPENSMSLFWLILGIFAIGFMITMFWKGYKSKHF